MKNSSKYSQKVSMLYRSLKSKYPKSQKTEYDEPLDTIIYAIVSENMSHKAAQSAIKRFKGYFVDWNDLRVSSPEEIVDVLGSDTSAARDTASRLTKMLGAVFNRYNTVSLKDLRKIGKRPAKQVLEKLEGISVFAVDYCMLTALGGHAIPLTQKMVEYLKENEMVHPDADYQETEGFLARQLSAQNAYDFYALLRRESEERKTGEKIKTKTKTKTKK